MLRTYKEAARLMPKLHQHTARLTVWFQQSEMGMEKQEILSRATTFATVHPHNGRLVFFTPQHVVAPWRYPDYHAYAMDWLQHVDEKHCTYCLDVRAPDDTGDMTRHHFDKVHYHDTRDVATLQMHPEAEARLKGDLARQNMVLKPVQMRHELQLEEHESCYIAGYEVEEEEDASEDESPAADKEDTREQFPFYVTGAFTLRTERQAYVKTSEVLNFGMCGAPVLDHQQRCCGLVEGIVPSIGDPKAPPPELQSPLYRRVEGNAGVVEADELYHLMIFPPQPAYQRELQQ
ncbi:hypothetical protein JKP88DRAFT_227708 [Tribonema minus]|uniref:Uncharacterized protein n=1 Tax=Tribonema minus TaxID=303371 RepID=A0A835YJL3_9STRA|nr:hypothetical protein JKP88DRAFT_227708 [Tribonema minus]